MSEDAKKSQINPANIRQFLEENPDFFNENKDLLLHINVPHESGAAVSLVERQTQVMRESNKELRSRLNKLMDIARENDVHFENTKKLILALLETKDFSDLMSTLESLLPKYLAADDYSLIINENSGARSLGFNHDKLIYTSNQDLPKRLQNAFESMTPICGRLSQEEMGLLFPDDAKLVSSAAVIPLSYKGFTGFLAVGSFREKYFHKGMGTLFLSYISEIISRVCFKRLDTKGESQIAI